MAREAIFIGYRREDTVDVAGRIYDALTARFGRDQIFKDVDSLWPGADFGAHIQSLLPQCRTMLVLIGPAWVTALDDNGRRRLADPNDWVRVEIETALATPALEVVPVLVNGAHMPRAEDLPESLHPLLRRHAANIRRDPDFHGDVSRLASALAASIQSGMLDLDNLSAARPQPDKISKNTTEAAGGAFARFIAFLGKLFLVALFGPIALLLMSRRILFILTAIPWVSYLTIGAIEFFLNQEHQFLIFFFIVFLLVNGAAALLFLVLSWFPPAFRRSFVRGIAPRKGAQAS